MATMADPPLAARVAISLILVIALLSLVDRSDIERAMLVPLPALAVSIVVFALSQVTAAIKLWWLLKAATAPQPGPSFIAVLHATFASFFASNFLPGTVGGDLAKGALLIARGLDKISVVSAVVADRLTNLAAMIVLFAVSGISLWGLAGWPLPALSGSGLLWPALIAAALVAALVLLARRWPGEKIKALLPRPLVEAFGAAGAHVARWRSSPATIALVAAMSLAGFLLSVLAQWLLLPHLQIDISAPLLAFAICFGTLAGLVPISLNGIGVQEAGIAAILVAGGLDPNSAALIAIASRILTLGASLIGGLAMIVRAP